MWSPGDLQHLMSHRMHRALSDHTPLKMALTTQGKAAVLQMLSGGFWRPHRSSEKHAAAWLPGEHIVFLSLRHPWLL
jgi:hypothetical protein